MDFFKLTFISLEGNIALKKPKQLISLTYFSAFVGSSYPHSQVYVGDGKEASVYEKLTLLFLPA